MSCIWKLICAKHNTQRLKTFSDLACCHGSRQQWVCEAFLTHDGGVNVMHAVRLGIEHFGERLDFHRVVVS